MLLSFSLGVNDGFETVSKDVGSSHVCDFVVKIIKYFIDLMENLIQTFHFIELTKKIKKV